jgi:outer membrane protein assembly factor BamB
MLAIRPDGNGDVTDTHVLWRMGGKDVPATPSPVVVSGLLYMVSDSGILNCIEATTGKVVYRQSLGGSMIASPIHDGERIYFFSLSGKAVILRAGRTFEKLGENRLDAGFMASPAVSGNTLILRTKTHLYAIEGK